MRAVHVHGAVSHAYAREPPPETVHRSRTQTGAATPVPTDAQPIASIPTFAPAPMRRLMSAPGRRERAAALMHPWWRSTGRAEASSLGWGSDRHQGRPPASRSAAASQQRLLAQLLQPLGSCRKGRREAQSSLEFALDRPRSASGTLRAQFGLFRRPLPGRGSLCCPRQAGKNPDRRSRPGQRHRHPRCADLRVRIDARNEHLMYKTQPPRRSNFRKWRRQIIGRCARETVVPLTLGIGPLLADQHCCPQLTGH
jgi:hypothetical protein